MKKTYLSKIIASVAVAGFAFALAGRAADTSKVSWKISGEIEEACSCSPACPCWFKSRPTRMTCDGAQIVFITKGRYGKVPLNGLALAEFVQSPEHKSMFESFGHWNFDYIYIDAKATDEQRAALKEVAQHLFPPAAKAREYRYVTITRAIQGDEHTSTVGQSAVVSGHLISGGYGGPPKLSNSPLADPTHKQYLQGETTKLSYSDAGQGWDYENSNYMRNKFVVDNKQYEKYEAKLAKDMGRL